MFVEFETTVYNDNVLNTSGNSLKSLAENSLKSSEGFPFSSKNLSFTLELRLLK
jgi:hypothetical protein